MVDEQPTVTAPVESDEGVSWSSFIAAKKFIWALATWKASVAAGTTLAPTATQTIQKISQVTSTFGIAIYIDKPVFESMIPVVIFAAGIMAHDFAKMKTNSKWL